MTPLKGGHLRFHGRGILLLDIVDEVVSLSPILYSSGGSSTF